MLYVKETAVSMNMFLNTVLPVQTQIQKNRDNVYTDFFDGFKTAHEILKEQLDYINDALPWASLATIAAAPAAAPVTAPMAVSIAAYLEFIEVCSNTMAAVADLIEKLLIDDLLKEEISFDTYKDELYNVFGDLLYMAENIIGRKSSSALKVSREVYSSLENEGLDETKKAVSEIGEQILKKELYDLAEDAAEDAKEEKEKIKDVVSYLEEAIRKSGSNNNEKQSTITIINPNKIRYSQSSVNGSNDIIQSMKKNGWQGDPIDVVKMPDGIYTTIDNTRVVSARKAGINVQASVHNYNDLLPVEYIERFTTKNGIPRTWGEAIELRVKKQKASFRNGNSYGKFDIETIK